jgi:hypothetical protein
LPTRVKPWAPAQHCEKGGSVSETKDSNTSYPTSKRKNKDCQRKGIQWGDIKRCDLGTLKLQIVTGVLERDCNRKVCACV